MSVYYNKDKTLARVSCDDGWFLINREGKKIGDIYTRLEEWADGYYLVEKGAKKNILRLDGSLVLREWHNNIYEYSEGFFFFGNTIPKSKNNPNTKYIKGLAHVDGNVVFPMIFTYARWSESDLFYAEIDDKPYLLATDGSIYDYARGHMPKRIRIDEFQLLNDYLNWTFSDLQFFYRDTDTPIDVKDTYHVGDILRAGFYIDMTYKLQRPAHKTRFLIASAHAARICEVVGAYMLNPDLEKWGLCTLHFNSYLRVMDVYEKDGVTQVFLLHIPEVARHLFRGSWFDFKLKTENKNHGEILVDDARRSLDEKLAMEVHPLSMDEDFVDRMSHPVGLDSKLRLYPMERMDETFSKDVAELSEFIHKIANDADIEMYKEIDNFPYKGVEGSVCEGCIYSKEISGNGLDCGNLSTEPFRLRYIRRSCEYKKTDVGALSKYEQEKKEEEERAKEHLEKSTDVFALNLLRAFVRERMGGNVKNLKYFDFNTLNGDSKYGEEEGHHVSATYTMLA
ncbi:MAG: hypothetical protein LUD72_08225, partial [Bacteroidales bacterium]|nr:hypothetical protein [Bacteroidales bacterium]